MTLHEAIIKVFEETGKKELSTQEIADLLNENGLYEKRDCSEITAFQIVGRTSNYDHLFNLNGSIISLK